MIFLKNIIKAQVQQNLPWLNHLLIGVLASYRTYLKSVAFHGHVSHSSIIGIDSPSGSNAPQPNRRHSFINGSSAEAKKGGETPLQELFDYRYKLIYHHDNMITIKEWLNKRILAIEENAK